MSRVGIKQPERKWAWWAVPLAVWALSSAVVGVLAFGWLAPLSAAPTFSLFFSDFAHMKVWLASASLVLALGQLAWAARMYGLVRFPPSERFYSLLHRWAGRVALLLTVPVAYHCLILVGQSPIDLRVGIHAALGAFLYGVIAAKLLLVRRRGVPGWILPTAGGVLFVVLLGLWLTSVPWFVGKYGLSL